MAISRRPARRRETLGRTSAASAWLAISGPPSTRVTLRSPSSVDDRTTTVLPPPQPVCTPGSTTSGSVGGTVAEPPETHTRCICNRVGGEEQRMADDAHDGSHLQLGRGQRHAGRDQPPRAFVVGRHDDAAVVEHRGSAVHELHPGVVAVLEQHGGLDRRVVADGGGQDLQVALVPALHRQHDALGLGPLDVGQVRERGRGPTRSRGGCRRGRAPRASPRRWPSRTPDRRAPAAPGRVGPDR